MARGLVVFDVVAAAAAARPDAVALRCGGDVSTYRELHARSEVLAAALRRFGLSRGDRVVVWADPRSDHVAATIAALRCGAVLVPVAADADPDLAGATVEATRPRAVVADGERFELASGAGGRQPAHVLGVGEQGPDGDLADPAVAGVPSPVPFLRSSDSAPAVAFAVGETPRRLRHAVVSHRAMWLRTRGSSRPGPAPTVVIPGSFGDAGALGALLRTWQQRGTAVVTSGDLDDTGPLDGAVVVADARRWLALAQRCPPGALAGVAEAEVATEAPVDDVLEAVHALAGDVAVRLVLESATAGPIASGRLDDPGRPPASAGTVDPLVTVDVVDGELVVVSPMVMTEWFDDPDTTSEHLVDERHHTRLTGVVDGAGYVTVTGHVEDAIAVGTADVDPADVERIVREHPGVAEVVVVGVPDDETGSAVCAVVVPTAEAPTLEELRDFTRTRLSRILQPTRLEIMDRLPRTPDGEVNRRLVAETVLSSDDGDR